MSFYAIRENKLLAEISEFTVVFFILMHKLTMIMMILVQIMTTIIGMCIMNALIIFVS